MEAAVEGLRRYVEFLRGRVGGGELLEFLEGELERALAWTRLRAEGCRVVLRLADGAPAYRASAAVKAIFVLDNNYRLLALELEVTGCSSPRAGCGVAAASRPDRRRLPPALATYCSSVS